MRKTPLSSREGSSNPKGSKAAAVVRAVEGDPSKCRIIDLPKITDVRGNLTFVESGRHLPFEMKRVFYLYDVPGGAERAGHALKTCQQFLVAMSGSFDVLLDDGYTKMRFHLNRSYYGLYIPALVWREMYNFSSGSVCLVIASEFYNEADYYRDHQAFAAAVRQGARRSSPP